MISATEDRISFRQLHLRIPEPLYLALKSAARDGCEPESVIVRRALRAALADRFVQRGGSLVESR